MRCEAMQMDRMGIDDRFGSDTGDAMRRMMDIRRRMRLERQREEELNEPVSDQCGD